MNIEININRINEEKEKLSSVIKKMEELENDSMNNTLTLKDYWQSKTSNHCYEEFDKYKKAFDSYIEDCKKLVAYLQEVVVNGYKAYDENVNKNIDENLSTF